MKLQFLSKLSRLMLAALATIGLQLTLTPLMADVTITTLPPSNSVQPWGTPTSGSTPTYGQLVIAPAGNPILKTVTFSISNGNLMPIPYQASVYAWNGTVATGTAITGPALFTSATMSVK